MHRTHRLGDLTKKDVGKDVILSGWVDTVRDHGGVTFIEIRDQFGIMQIVANEVDKLPSKESVIKVSGKVRLRDKDTINPRINTGEIEVMPTSIEVISKAKGLPFDIDVSHKAREELRLQYRFLDLRNPIVKDRIIQRSKIISSIRSGMEKMGFLDLQTPILTASSPEGARDYLVPSRKHKGKFYALPQAPQIFKQLFMTSGFDRYFQIAPCFRDEDARADRTAGEFYQLDCELAFATQSDVFKVAEKILSDTFKKFTKKKVSKFIQIPYDEAQLKYGTDKPDLRNPLIIEDLTEFFTTVDFPLFKGKPTRAIRVPKCAKEPRSFFDAMLEFAFSIGMKGLGYISVVDGVLKGPIVKFLDEAKQKELKLKDGDVIFFICDNKSLVDKLAGQIRVELGRKLKLLKDTFEFCFITDFPMYEVCTETKKPTFSHNPFSMPQSDLSGDPLQIKAFQYDVVCNGVELASGAVRNHCPETMVKAFEIAGYKEETIKAKFGSLYNAFQYGAPPHAGFAFGIDRVIMLITEQENVREVIAFPLNSNHQDMLLGAPSVVSEKQLREIHIKLREELK